jgi:hypothetical protein
MVNVMSNTSHAVTIGSQYVQTGALRFARNQREAGIEHLEWESRIRPLRPLVYDVALATGLVMAVVGVCAFA